MNIASKKGSLEFHINLRNIKNERAFLMKMKESFHLPDYFGFTLDGLDDCMQSLEWIEHNNILAKFYHLDEVKAHNELVDQKKQEIKKLKRKDRIEIIETDIDISKTVRKIKHIKSIRKQVGVVFQFAEYQLFESTIEKDIIFGPVSVGVNKEKAKELAKKYIKIVGLPEDYLQRSPFNLSGGQKRRVALAGILAMEPAFLILDEPTAGLDPYGVNEMLQLFYDINQKSNTTIIIVTHDLDNALR